MSFERRMERCMLGCLLFSCSTIPLVNSGMASAQVLTANRVDGVYNIRDYGAIGDGETDETQAIQKAIDAASQAGGIVLVPVGHWLCRGHLEIKMGVHLAGMNVSAMSWEPATGSI